MLNNERIIKMCNESKYDIAFLIFKLFEKSLQSSIFIFVRALFSKGGLNFHHHVITMLIIFTEEDTKR